MSAMTIFTMTIRYLKKHFQHLFIERCASGISESEILWVLTVPGIWNDSAKQFMREAAQNAGISGDQLVIALDTEAAIMFFKSNILHKRLPGSTCVDVELLPGKKILVVDDGGGLVDSSVFQIQDDGKFCQIHAASGGGWGCVQVDWAFTQLLIKIVGAKVMLRFKQEEDYLELCRELEIKKRNFDPNRTDYFRIEIPISLSEIYQSMTGENISDAITQTSYGIKLKMQNRRMLMDPEVMKSLFQPLIHDLIEHMHGIFKTPNIQDTDIIFMVGGFSEASILQEAVKREFPNKSVIVPDNAEYVSLLGGILYAYQPSTISARISRYTYGIEGVRKFKPRDPLSKKKIIDGKEMCINVFSKHVEIGETLMVGHSKPELRYTPSTHDQLIAFCLYSSTSSNPLFVTDSSCYYLGKLLVDMPKVNGRTSKQCGIFVKLIFYDTEIKVEARNEITNQVTSAKFNFLGQSEQTLK
ncbi:hypothetical protein CHS0354_012936 [Potamilus streckersoni]|uniref:Heat shock 70 kDa protein 12A n=1 Tax=Potamilus streckersoni TaxID=2493646 RepID=A0AAE0RNP7_9BIVA|nr:hypothetical protein CHS0354_012936 [Potamilus streckersoni]